MYTDQTGKFAYLSSKGMRYIIIEYHTKTNYILSKPTRNRKKSQMLKIYKKIIMRMKTSGLGTKRHVLDNGKSK